MSLIAFVLLTLSAVIHAAWNLVGKKEHPSTAFFLMANLFGSLLFIPVFVMYGSIFRDFPGVVWMYLVITSFFLALYYIALAGAYRSGDMSIAYPLARSSPIIVVTVVALILGRGDQVSSQCVIGIVLVVGACFLLPMKRFSDFRIKNYINLTCMFALMAAIGTTGYSICDDEALRILRESSGIQLGKIPLTLLYAGAEAVIGGWFLLLFVGLRKDGRRTLRKVLRSSRRQFMMTGVGIYAGYTLVLVSLAFVRNVSYVVAFRQLSILLGTGCAIFILREPAYRPKIIGVIILFIGLMLVGLG